MLFDDILVLAAVTVSHPPQSWGRKARRSREALHAI